MTKNIVSTCVQIPNIFKVILRLIIILQVSNKTNLFTTSDSSAVEHLNTDLVLWFLAVRGPNPGGSRNSLAMKIPREGLATFTGLVTKNFCQVIPKKISASSLDLVVLEPL